MNLHGMVQALWPGLWLSGIAFMMVRDRDQRFLPMAIVLSVWLVLALALHPRRRWSWWCCLAPLVLLAVLGLGLFFSLILMVVYPDSPYWSNANQPGALAIIGGSFLLTPSALLLWHLFAIRRRFLRG
jgi:hypothetical protein